MSDQQNLPATQKETALVLPPDSGAFTMQGFEHAQRIAIALSKSTIVPQDYRDNVPNTLVALEMANRMGASPLAVMQNLYIVKGRPGWSSTFIIATLNSCGRFSNVRFEFSGEAGKDDFGCVATATDKHSGQKLIGPKVTLAMARGEGWLNKDGSKWKTMPELMFQYRAASFFGRLYASDLLMGMQSTEELADVEPPVPPPQQKMEQLKAKRDGKPGMQGTIEMP